MPNCVFLNEIFQGQFERTLKHRVDFARQGRNVVDFWLAFFGCQREHKDNQFVYIFTKQQLRYLRRLWNNLVQEAMKDKTKDSFLADLHCFIYDLEKAGKPVTTQPAYYIEYTGPATKKSGEEFDLKKLSLVYCKSGEWMRKRINLFTGTITEDEHDPGLPTDDKAENEVWVKYMRNLTGKIKGKLLNVPRPGKRENNWLFYNGSVVNNENEVGYFPDKIFYCREKNHQCPYRVP